MFWEQNSQDAASQATWWADRDAFLERVARQIPQDRLALALFFLPAPQPDELLVVHGWPAEVLTRWSAASVARDPLFRTARRRGVSIEGAHNGPTRPAPIDRDQVMVAMFPESLTERRWWSLLLARRETPFTDEEQHTASLMLRQWQIEFNFSGREMLGRLVLGHDDRVIHIDPHTQSLALEHPQMLDHLRQSLHTVVDQRWPNLPDRQRHDYAIQLNERPYWICFHRDRAVDLPRSMHWLVELRSLESDELPTVGGIEDPRIARAVGYLHDNFHESPSLARIADAVHVSPFHFHRLFTRYVGVSPKQYLQRKQLQVARWLLRSTRLPVGTIATRTGFSSHGHFTSTFHRLTGASPTQYREAH
jgi:AraC-like DNA-binding protein